MPIGPQIGSLEHGAHIVVGTPGRIEDHLRKGTLNLSTVDTLVLDEADRMLDMGFQPVLDRIVEHIPSDRQTLLFSATFPPGIESIAQRIMNQPVRITVEEPHDERSIEELFSPIDGLSRPEAVRLLLLAERPNAALVFCNTKQGVKALTQHLNQNGLNTQALHGDLDQRERDQTMVLFDNNSCSILVATDVAARGLDIDAMDLVINHEIARDSAVHTHRVGRTGRAGRQGKAITLFDEKERFKLARLGDSLTIEPLPDKGILTQPPYRAPMATLQIDGGKKQKVRRGDILGALTAPGGLDGQQVGKIHLQDLRAYVAVKRSEATLALEMINKGKLKGRQFRARLVR